MGRGDFVGNFWPNHSVQTGGITKEAFMATLDVPEPDKARRSSDEIEDEMAAEVNVAKLRQLSKELDEALLVEEREKVLRRLKRVSRR